MLPCTQTVSCGLPNKNSYQSRPYVAECMFKNVDLLSLQKSTITQPAFTNSKSTMEIQEQ